MCGFYFANKKKRKTEEAIANTDPFAIFCAVLIIFSVLQTQKLFRAELTEIQTLIFNEKNLTKYEMFHEADFLHLILLYLNLQKYSQYKLLFFHNIVTYFMVAFECFMFC